MLEDTGGPGKTSSVPLTSTTAADATPFVLSRNGRSSSAERRSSATLAFDFFAQNPRIRTSASPPEVPAADE
eukprot:gene16265-33686_t